MEIDVDEYVESFKVQMMDVVYAWSTGSTFADICKMTDVFEGLFVFSSYYFICSKSAKYRKKQVFRVMKDVREEWPVSSVGRSFAL